MCHNLLHDSKIFQMLYRVDEFLAEEARTTRCTCGGKWHREDYPRKPRSCFTGFQNAVRLTLQLLPQEQNISLRAVFRAPGLSGPRHTADGRTADCQNAWRSGGLRAARHSRTHPATLARLVDAGLPHDGSLEGGSRLLSAAGQPGRSATQPAGPVCGSTRCCRAGRLGAAHAADDPSEVNHG